MTRPLPGLPPPVIDSEAGILRLMGNRALYLRVLARFRSDYGKAATALRGALDAGEMGRAQRLVHTLKGAAGMIEAPALYAAALALEDILRGGRRDAAAPLARLEAALAEVLSTLDAMDLTVAATPPSVPVPATGQGDTVSRLRALLDIGDGAAVDFMAAAHSELRAHLGEREFAALNAAMAEFDYERALEVLDRPGAAAS